MSAQSAENDAPRVENGWCLDCASHTCEHAHAVDPDSDCRCPGCCPIPPVVCPSCGHEPHMTGWCVHDSHPACDCNADESDIPPVKGES